MGVAAQSREDGHARRAAEVALVSNRRGGPYIDRLYAGPTTLWSSAVLNPIAGGPELWAAESAAAMGARVIFLPTWGSCHDLESGGGIILEHLKRIYPTFRTACRSRVRGFWTNRAS